MPLKNFDNTLRLYNKNKLHKYVFSVTLSSDKYAGNRSWNLVLSPYRRSVSHGRPLQSAPLEWLNFLIIFFSLFFVHG